MITAPRVYAHRFGGDYGPEGSRAALERTLAGPVDGLEADVVLTADDEVVACHDPLLDISTADRRGWANETEAEALKSGHLLDDKGQPSDQSPLLLREVLEAIPSGLPLQLDVKAYADPGLAGRTARRSCEIAAELGRIDQIEVISFFTPACEAAVTNGVDSRLVIWADYDPTALVRWAVDRGIKGLSVEGFILGPSLREVAREAELTISVGAANTAEQLQMLLRFEPEIIVSDRPHALHDLVRRFASLQEAAA